LDQEELREDKTTHSS